MPNRYIKTFLLPVIEEITLFMSVIILLTQRTIFSLVKNYPNLFSLSSQNGMVYGFRFVSIATVIAYFFCFVVFKTKSRIVKFIIYVVCYTLFSINLFLAINYKAAISPNILQMILETNTTEIGDFINTYIFTWKSAIVYIIVVIVIGLNYLLEKNRSRIKQMLIKLTISAKYSLVCLFFIFLVGGLYSFRIYPQLFSYKTLEEASGWNRGGDPYMDYVTGLLYSGNDLYLMSKSLNKAISVNKSLSKQTNRYIWESDTCNVILVIGESFNKYHSNLYGYSLPTNPRLKREKDAGRLVLFNDVISPIASTSPAIRNMLSCNSMGDGENWYDYPFFPAIFKCAGYNVYNWDNQYRQMSSANFDFRLNAYIFHKEFIKTVYDAVHEWVSLYDDELINNFEKFTLNNKFSKNNLVIFHLHGQHFSQKDRYPNRAPFMKFKVDDIKRKEPWMTDDKKQIIAHYDNCTYYNDSVISHIIRLYNNTSSVMVYLSDHGENVYDFGEVSGRTLELTRKDGRIIHQLNDIPFFVWYSDKYKLDHPEIISKLQKSKDKPLISDNICHMLFEIGGIVSEYYLDNRNVLSPQYNCPPRVVNDSINYDDVK